MSGSVNIDYIVGVLEDCLMKGEMSQCNVECNVQDTKLYTEYNHHYGKVFFNIKRDNQYKIFNLVPGMAKTQQITATGYKF